MKSIRVRSKVWLEVDGEPFLGDGRYRLLQAVQRSGSISAAAMQRTLHLLVAGKGFLRSSREGLLGNRNRLTPVAVGYFQWKPP
jgi:hypothetical protein